MKPDSKLILFFDVIFAAVLLGILIATLLFVSYQRDHYRRNAMDLCAWHARIIFADDPNTENQRWVRVRSGELMCPFCGQKHGSGWVSRNAWESQLNAMLAENDQ